MGSQCGVTSSIRAPGSGRSSGRAEILPCSSPKSRGAGGDLAASDLDALVRLGMRAEPDASLHRDHRHPAEIAFEGCQVEDERRCVQP